MKNAFQDFWQQRQPRERAMLSFTCAVVALALLYALAINPAVNGRQRLQKNLPALRQQSAELNNLLARVKEMPAAAVQTGVPISKEAVVENLKHKGLTAKNVMAAGDSAKVEFTGVAFASLIDWLGEVQQTARWQVTENTIDAQAAPGLVNASLTLRQNHE